MSDKLKVGDRVFVGGKTWVAMGTIDSFYDDGGDNVPWIKLDNGDEWSAYDVTIRRPSVKDRDFAEQELGKDYQKLLAAWIERDEKQGKDGEKLDKALAEAWFKAGDAVWRHRKESSATRACQLARDECYANAKDKAMAKY